MNKIKKYIPNVLTISRLIATPFIVYLGVKNEIVPLIIIAIFIALTDFLDGKLARLWNVSSEIGAKLDAIGDKVLALGLLIILVVDNHMFFWILALESCIALFNFYVFMKEHYAESLLVGKIKTWVIFITMILGLFNLLFPSLKVLVNISVVLTVVLQFISLCNYIATYQKKKRKKIGNLENKEYYNLVKEIITNKEFLKRKEYEHHYNESVYDHVLRVSYDCYKIGKRLKLDYKSLAIAGLLHDFYDKPWQDVFDKTKFFEKHGFVHAEQARKNAIKYFPNLVDEKIGSMIKTHMFPLNKKIPEYKESWILTIVDKADSMDFLLHPYLLSRKMRSKIEKKMGKIK